MKPAAFDYLAPTTLDDAVAALQNYGMDAKVIAGGQSLMPVLAMRLSRFEYLIDLNRVPELAFIREDGDAVVIGAMTREAKVGYFDVDVYFDDPISTFTYTLTTADFQNGSIQVSFPEKTGTLTLRLMPQ